MSGLRPVAAFFIVFATIAWGMVALSIAKTATLPLAAPSYQTLLGATGADASSK